MYTRLAKTEKQRQDWNFTIPATVMCLAAFFNSFIVMGANGDTLSRIVFSFGAVLTLGLLIVAALVLISKSPFITTTSIIYTLIYALFLIYAIRGNGTVLVLPLIYGICATLALAASLSGRLKDID